MKLSDHAKQVLLEAHNHPENQTFVGASLAGGGKVRPKAVGDLADAGLVDVTKHADQHEPAFINFGQHRSYKDRVISGGTTARVTAAGREMAESLGGTPKHQCTHPEGCTDIIPKTHSMCAYHRNKSALGRQW